MPQHEAERFEDRTRGARDAASLLPVVAGFLLAPPLILIFAAPVVLGGMPLIVVYLFGVWAAVIVAAFVLSRSLRGLGEAAHDGTDGRR